MKEILRAQSISTVFGKSLLPVLSRCRDPLFTNDHRSSTYSSTDLCNFAITHPFDFKPPFVSLSPDKQCTRSCASTGSICQLAIPRSFSTCSLHFSDNLQRITAFDLSLADQYLHAKTGSYVGTDEFLELNNDLVVPASKGKHSHHDTRRVDGIPSSNLGRMEVLELQQVLEVPSASHPHPNTPCILSTDQRTHRTVPSRVPLL